MSDELPEGWAPATLVDVCRSVTDGDHRAPPKRATGVPFITIAAINDGTLRLDRATRFVPPEYFEALKPERRAELGDVLFSVTGSLGLTALVDVATPFVFQRHIAILKPDKSRLLERFLLHRLAAPDIKAQFDDVATGTAQLTIPLGGLREFSFGLPPLPEQRRIVAKIEELLEEVNRAKARITRVRAILRRFRHSVLATACSGELTREWRDDHPETQPGYDDVEPPDGRAPLPQGWCWVPFGLLVESLRMGTTVPPGIEPTRFPVLRSSSVRPGVIDLSDVRFLQADKSANEDTFVREGDLLFTRLSGSLDYVANCAVVRDLGKRRIQYPDRLFRARLRDVAMADFIELCFGSPLLRKSLEVASKSSAGHQRISMGALTDFWIPLAPPGERLEIMRRARELLRFSEALEARLQAAGRRTEKLPRAILSKAFAGELVPTEAELARLEGRDYEPASVLLERMKADAATVPTTKEKRSTKRQQGVSA